MENVLNKGKTTPFSSQFVYRASTETRYFADILVTVIAAE